MHIIHKSAKANAFMRGVLSGMAAPVLLFSPDLPKINRIEPIQESARDSLRGDWIRIGNDFGTAISREEKAIAAK